MNTIWVLEDGDYSDYHVIGVFTSKQNAELVQSRVGGEIAEWPLNPGVKELSQGHTPFVGEMRYDGSVERMQSRELSSYTLINGVALWPRSSAPAYAGKNIQDCLHGVVLAKDQKHAIKIFNEKRVQLIASGEFKPPKE